MIHLLGLEVSKVRNEYSRRFWIYKENALLMVFMVLYFNGLISHFTTSLQSLPITVATQPSLQALLSVYIPIPPDPTSSVGGGVLGRVHLRKPKGGFFAHTNPSWHFQKQVEDRRQGLPSAKYALHMEKPYFKQHLPGEQSASLEHDRQNRLSF